jgi:hypothetical protein
MAGLKLNQLRDIVLTVYEAGHRGCLDLREDYADEFIQALMIEINKGKANSGEWRVYTVKEISQRPIGTMFEHTSLGKCWIDGTEKLKHMTFENGSVFHLLEDDEPWLEKIREIGKL